MSSFEHNGASIDYETVGGECPILAFVPAGLQAVIDVSSGTSAPINLLTEFADDFQVLAMDQRNAGGRSHAPMSAQSSWHRYTADPIAVLDHLGGEPCHLYGPCIGGPFIMSPIEVQPDRVVCAVLAQPIGRVEAALPPCTERFNARAASLTDHSEVTEQVLDVLYENLYGPGFADCVDRDFIPNCRRHV